MKGWGIEAGAWERFEDWLVSCNDEAVLRSQGVGGLRAGLRHRRGLALSDADQDWLVRGATAHATQLALADRVRAVVDGDVAVLKGPEVACRHPEPAWRTSTDLDLLSADADGLWQALVDHGFAPLDAPERYRRHHHLAPLHLPGFRLAVEVHRGLGWPGGAIEPATADLLASSVVARSHDGFRALAPELAFAHQLQHAWHAVPYGTVRDLVDLAVLWDGTDPAALDRVLDEARLGGLHRATRAVARAVVAGEPAAAPVVARTVASPTVLRGPETSARAVPRRLVGLFAAAGPRFATRSLARSGARAVARVPGDVPKGPTGGRGWRRRPRGAPPR